MSPLLRFTAPFCFPGPNISVPLSLYVYFWVMPAVPFHKTVRLWGPSHQSLSSFHLVPNLVVIILFLSSLIFFLSFLIISCFFSLLLSVPGYTPLRQNPGWMTNDIAYGFHRDGHHWVIERFVLLSPRTVKLEYGPVQTEFGSVSTNGLAHTFP